MATTKRFFIIVLEKHWIQLINTLLVWEEWHGQLPASQRVWRHDFERFFIWGGYEQVPNNLASKEVEITALCLKCLRCWDIIACFNSSVLHLLLEISVMRHIANLRTFQSITSNHQKWINRGVNLDTIKIGWSSNPKNQYQASSLCLSLHLYIGIFHHVSQIDTRLWWVWKKATNPAPRPWKLSL